MDDIYVDGRIECAPDRLRIHDYYFPWGTKSITYSSIRNVRRVTIGALTGRGRLGHEQSAILGQSRRPAAHEDNGSDTRRRKVREALHHARSRRRSRIGTSLSSTLGSRRWNDLRTTSIATVSRERLATKRRSIDERALRLWGHFRALLR